MSSTDHLGNGNLLVPAAVQAGGAALEPETASGRLTAPDVGRQQSAFSPQRSVLDGAAGTVGEDVSRWILAKCRESSQSFWLP